VVELMPPKEDTPPKKRDMSYLSRLAKPRESLEPPAIKKYKIPKYGKIKEMLPKIRAMQTKKKNTTRATSSKKSKTAKSEQ
jgi:hypothetical protein